MLWVEVCAHEQGTSESYMGTHGAHGDHKTPPRPPPPPMCPAFAHLPSCPIHMVATTEHGRLDIITLFSGERLTILKIFAWKELRWACPLALCLLLPHPTLLL